MLDNPPLLYILDADGMPKAEPNVLRWGRWFENTANRLVARTEISESVAVSTVFLGIDHRFSWDGEPVLWETMVFRDGDGGDCERYTSQAAAIAGHWATVERERLAATGDALERKITAPEATEPGNVG
jgi:hypothetical protein